MKNFRLGTTNRSLDYYAKSLIFLLIPILFVNITLSWLSITTIKKQNLDNVSGSINIYAGSLQRELTAIDHFMFWSVLHETSLNNLAEGKNYYEYSKATQGLRTRLNDFEYSLTNNYTFFAQIQNKNLFVNASSLKMSYQTFQIFKAHFQDTELKTTSSSVNVWEELKVNGEDYLLRTVVYQNKALHAVIAVDDILEPLRSMNIGKNGIVSIEKPQGQANNLFKGLLGNHLFSYPKEQTSLPFPIYVLIDYPGAFKNMLLLQFVILLIPILIGVLALVILFYVRRNVIKPVKRFTDRIIRVSKEEPIALSDESITELKDVNDEITNMVREMQSLRIDVYEAELAQKRIDLNFLRSQIQPHFYLNILSTIHSMVNTGNYEEIEQLSLATSKYLRYLFSSSQDFVALDQELKHIEDYLSIQKLRYGDAFHFYLKINPALRATGVPPLLLQTFIENSVKHSYSGDQSLVIDMNINYANTARSHLSIVIKDNGPGFPEEVLTKLQHKESLITADGKHIGLTNTLERLDLLYGHQNYQLTFKNQVGHGALIQLILPLHPMKEE
ncbi:sensor histidine kinase [Enterococcus nangangensis]|uniref:sensor histidine kinase n=1 Tax=Enterococcus nangangensis TaxID=2559926 RepID=UPI0010F6E41D|nr:histidine kinase [Enterococcus nangangensis]